MLWLRICILYIHIYIYKYIISWVPIYSAADEIASSAVCELLRPALWAKDRWWRRCCEIGSSVCGRGERVEISAQIFAYTGVAVVWWSVGSGAREYVFDGAKRITTARKNVLTFRFYYHVFLAPRPNPTCTPCTVISWLLFVIVNDYTMFPSSRGYPREVSTDLDAMATIFPKVLIIIIKIF